ncbi:MAG: hypothetical protein MI919_17620, partial [Holophagales bacterium]|nr:hypothetical protein [Holophagales bacterium]
MSHVSDPTPPFRALPSAAGTAAILCLLTAVAPAAAGELFEHVDPSFQQHEYWLDGKAEINLYEAEVKIYGQPRTADQLAHIVVSEDHDPELLVKADDWRRPGLIPMLKFNYVTGVQAGVYRYQQMFSFFFNRPSGRLA